MQPKHVCPLFSTPQISATRDFYVRSFDCRVVFENPGFVAVQFGEGGPMLSFMDPAAGEEPESKPDGLYYCLEVGDADAECARLRDKGVAVEQKPEDQPWGDRRFVVRDPNGIALYISHQIKPAPEFANDFK